MVDFQVVWRGPLRDATGYGRASREYVAELDKQSVDVKVETWSWGFPLKEIEKDKKDRLGELIAKPYAINKPKVLVYHSPPWNINPQEERKKFDRIVLNTVWETLKLPNEWVPTINKFDAVFVPSGYSVKAMIDSGVKVPIFLVPHGVNTNQFKPENKKLLLKQVEEKFVFVSVFEFQHRKNPEALLKSYWEEFTCKDNVALVIKTYWGRRSKKVITDKIYEYKKKLGMGNKTAPIFIITKFLGDENLKGIYRLGDAFVLPTRGEGVGLPFMEALSSGIPVIATGWGGQMDFLTEENSFLVDYRLNNPEISMNSESAISPGWRQLFAEEGQLWAEADIADLKKKMRTAYENPEICKQKGRQGRKEMLSLSWENAGIALKQAIENVFFTS